MKHCTQCGHLLGLGRFCTNCGAPGRRPRPAVRPALERRSPVLPTTGSTAPPSVRQRRSARHPPPRRPQRRHPRHRLRPASRRAVVEPPPPPRFPLFADEVADRPRRRRLRRRPRRPPAGRRTRRGAGRARRGGRRGRAGSEDDWEDERRPRCVRVLAAVAVLAVLVLGAWFLGQKISGGDDDSRPRTPRAVGSTSSPARPTPGRPHRRGLGRRAQDGRAERRRRRQPDVVRRQQHARRGPRDRPGGPRATRAAMKIVFTFDEKTRISQVGLINGYAKKARDGGKVLDWYEGTAASSRSRGSSPTARPSGRTSPTTAAPDDRGRAGRGTKVVLKIVATSEPGEGAARRDYTAISDVRVRRELAPELSAVAAWLET